MLILTIFLASFLQVFLLGLSSQFVRNQWLVPAFITSWFISMSQFIYTKIIAITEGGDVIYIFLSSGMGGSTGIVMSIFFYRWLLPKFKKG